MNLQPQLATRHDVRDEMPAQMAMPAPVRTEASSARNAVFAGSVETYVFGRHVTYVH